MVETDAVEAIKINFETDVLSELMFDPVKITAQYL
tara:strand:- start:710 stop:814 length:105 start_codon:yes stop_codon:yes gene_type:complete